MKNFEIQCPSWEYKERGVYGMVNGVLTYLTIKGCVAYISKQTTFVLCETPKGKSIEFAFGDLYGTIDDYKNGNTIKSNTIKLDVALKGNTEWQNEESQLFEKFLWRSENGTPTKTYLDFGDRLMLTTYGGLVDWQDPADHYKTREECMKWSDLVYIGKDGEKKTEKSVRKQLLLTDEQQAIIKEIAAAFKKAEDAGIQIGYDNYDCEFVGINISEVAASFEYDFCEEDFSTIIDRQESWQRFKLPIPAPQSLGDDDCICIK